MNDSRKDLHPDRTPTGHLDEAPPESRRPWPPAMTSPPPERPAPPASRREERRPVSKDREISGELDRAVDAPDHDVTRDKAGRR